MTQANQPNEYDRQLRHMNRRLERLEDTQIPPQELYRALDRVYDEIDGLEQQMNRRFDLVDSKIAEVEGKIDLILKHITGTNL
jgi:prefoldin subunit 5